MTFFSRRFALSALIVAATVMPAHAAAGITRTTPIRIDSVGALKVGMTIEEAEKAAGRITIHNNQDRHGECVFGELAAGPKDLSFMLIKGTIARFDVFEGAMKTAEGAGIGSSEDDVKRLYAGAHIAVTPHPYVSGHYLEISFPAHPGLKYIFETDGKKVTAFRAGRLPEIDWIEGCA